MRSIKAELSELSPGPVGYGEEFYTFCPHAQTYRRLYVREHRCLMTSVSEGGFASSERLTSWFPCTGSRRGRPALRGSPALDSWSGRFLLQQQQLAFPLHFTQQHGAENVPLS